MLLYLLQPPLEYILVLLSDVWPDPFEIRAKFQHKKHLDPLLVSIRQLCQSQHQQGPLP
jgi:hypothetical protein